jgi:hypothetical protein
VLAESASSLYTEFLYFFHSSYWLAHRLDREATRGCMGSLRLGLRRGFRLGVCAWVVLIVSSFLFLPACGGSKPPGPSPFPVKINLNPTPSASIAAGTVFQFVATAENNANSNISLSFVYVVTPLSQNSVGAAILDIAPNGYACAGAWNAPLYNACTPGNTGVVQVTATAAGASSLPTVVFVHPPIDDIQISVVPPVNAPPPACPNQTELPTACNLKFNSNAVNYCMSQNQSETLQATAYSQGVDVTSTVGTFTWSQATPSVGTIAPIVNSQYNVATNQATATANTTPGQTEIVATASGVSSRPYYLETCPVQCIALELSDNGALSGTTSFIANKGTTESITATAVDVQGCIVPRPTLTWVSSSPAALAAGGSGCSPGATCSVSTSQPGAAAITASCTPPTCNVGFPLNPAGYPAPYIPQPVYAVTAISGLVTGATTATTVLATSQDCYSDILCTVGIYNTSTATNIALGASPMPAPPNSIVMDLAGDRAYLGSEFGAFSVSPSSLGTSNNAFALLAAPGTPLGLVTGKALAVSHNGNVAIFSDTVSTPNQVYVVTTSPASTIELNVINSATAATFSPDGLKAFILGDGGNSLYIDSPLQALQGPVALPAPATSIVFNSTGAFALLSGGSAANSFAVYNTCDNSSVTLTSPGVPLPSPPSFLKMIPAGNFPLGSVFGNTTIPAGLDPSGLDFFFGLDDTGIDVIATNTFMAPTAALCPAPVTLAQIQPLTTPPTYFAPFHINIGQGTFHPINFFVSPDATHAYIVASDRSSVLVYDFNTDSVTAIPLVNNATPVAADITVDGTLIYVAASDGMLHQINIPISTDEYQVFFSPLANSTNSFCYTAGTSCSLDMVALKP